MDGSGRAQAVAAIGRGSIWQDALAEASASIQRQWRGGAADLAFLFACSDYLEEFSQLVAAARAAVGARLLVGCSSQGIIGTAREVEDQPALSLLACVLPGATLRPAYLTQEVLARTQGGDDVPRITGVLPGEVNAWVVFADPFSLDAEALLGALSAAYPGVPVVGGLASGDFRLRRTHVFLNDRVFDRGAVALGLGGAYGVRAVVSQGCTPIGEPWTITSAHGHVIETIARRPAYQVLADTVRGLPPDLRQRVRGNLLVGLAMDEHREELRRGDFLIRNLIGVDPDRGTLAVGAAPRPGHTLQFQLRDRASADEDLRVLLDAIGAGLGVTAPVAALLCSCNGRGIGLFGAPDHDARAVAERLGPIPLSGFFCNGEFGPVGSKNFLHGFTASLALLLPR